MRIMKAWSAFRANDINMDNRLDVSELNMLIWLMDEAKPAKAILEREIAIMDVDGNGTIDLIEWVSYLCAPVRESIHQYGNRNYYDFEMRSLFEGIDLNKDGSIDFDELCYFI